MLTLDPPSVRWAACTTTAQVSCQWLKGEKMSNGWEDTLALSRTTALPDEFLAEIGRVVANFALLERAEIMI